MSFKLGDRRDAVMLRKLDSMHIIMPLIMLNRADNEAFISERIDLTNINKYLEKKNSSDPEYKYNLFQIIVTALLKTITLRPKMNRFITNKILYQRREVTASFVIKKIFEDNSEEGMALLHARDDDNIDSIHAELYRQISKTKGSGKETRDKSSEAMDALGVIPRPILKAVFVLIRFLDRYGWLPQSLIATDPYRASVLISNLGSIKLNCGYHHLSNWGTNSLFVVIGEKKLRPFYNADGSYEMRDSVDIGITVDERIADGYYYSRTVKLLKKLLEEPELLENALSEAVDEE